LDKAKEKAQVIPVGKPGARGSVPGIQVTEKNGAEFGQFLEQSLQLPIVFQVNLFYIIHNASLSDSILSIIIH
jgi:hypothetical protein